MDCSPRPRRISSNGCGGRYRRGGGFGTGQVSDGIGTARDCLADFSENRPGGCAGISKHGK